MSQLSQYRQPQYLAQSHEPVHRLRCAIHGFIRFSTSERKIIDHPVFHRLRYVRQLALTELIYPGATHSRFEHSLGVMEMASCIFDRLAADQGAQMESMLGQVAALSENTMARARQVCRLAGLLHDTGHCCFSHAAESVIHKDSDHEALTVTVLTQADLLGGLIEDEFFEGCGDLIASLVKPGPQFAPQLQLLRDIISGQVDADRSDYLLRDSHHCGVDYGRFDHLRLIECLTCWADDESGQLLMGIKRDGIHSFESLILARYQMNTQVYYHRLRRIYDYYLKQYFSTMEPVDFGSPEKILAWNDVHALQRLFSDAENRSSAGHHWARRIVHRCHHKDVFSLDEGDGPQRVKAARRVAVKIREEFQGIDFVDDFPDAPVSIHKVARDDEDDRMLDDFPMIDRGKRTSLGERSQLLRTLPKSFRVGFLFADVKDDQVLRTEIARRCQALFSESN